jgi:hypothetical protein
VARQLQSIETQDVQIRGRSMRLPGFLVKEEIGLGDVIKRATSAVGIAPCGACEKRADMLNRWIHLARR